ncbi:exported hypothetical protein [Mesorhizobium sp. SOD10]|nr:exported hypothetical protein [Mesorhizobium sp. SOD10]
MMRFKTGVCRPFQAAASSASMTVPSAVVHLWSIYRLDDYYSNNQFYGPNQIPLEDPELQRVGYPAS